MPVHRIATLDYLSEYALGDRPPPQRRHVRLDVDRALLLNYEHFRFCSYGWRHARILEHRLGSPLNEGVWPINNSRCEFRLGSPGSALFPKGADLESVPPDVHVAALRGRILCYFRAISADEAIAFANEQLDFRHATQITSDWYDPINGDIECSDAAPQICGSHAVPLAEFDYGTSRFKFSNSWGGKWGDLGWGSLSLEHYNRFIIESWAIGARGVSVPRIANDGVICQEWKWSVSDEIGVHGREIVDARSGMKLAWAFCVKRRNTLDVEEFFVWPSERHKGYGRELARMILALAAQLGRRIRLLVSFADTYEWNIGESSAVARLLRVQLRESDLRCVHLIGEAREAPFNMTRERPQRPAFMLESLRRGNEQPITEPTRYEVLFGTNREMTVSDGQISFTGRRGDGLVYGWATVEIPRSCRFGSAGRWYQWFCKKQFPSITNTVVCNSREVFAARAQSCVSAIQVHDDVQNVLYIHGYNVPFQNAITQAAQFGVDLKVPGRMFAFSWPSLGVVPGYAADEATIEVSIDVLREFIELIMDCTERTPLSIIVHSMGNRAAVRVLEMIGEGRIANCIKHVIFAAPDVDAQRFRAAVGIFRTVPKSATLYATRGDWAVQLSEVIHVYPRAGLFPPILVEAGIDTVAVSGFNLLDIGHGYYAEAAPVLHDMFNIIHHGARPDVRPRLERITHQPDSHYWSLPLR